MPGAIYPCAWSPNGKRLAYIEHHYVAGPDPVGPTVSLRTIDPNGGSPAVVLDDPRIGPALWWAPDGRILFAYREDPASKQNNYGVYSIQVDEQTGKAAGTPHQITRAEGGIDGLNATADGKRLVLSRTNAPAEVSIAKFDARSHQWKEPRRLTLDSNENIADAWTLDSKAVLFVSNRNGTWKLFKQNIDETTPELLVEGPGISLPRLSADGTQVLYLSAFQSGGRLFPCIPDEQAPRRRASSRGTAGEGDHQLRVCAGALESLHLQQPRGTRPHFSLFRSRTRSGPRGCEDTGGLHELEYFSGWFEACSFPR
jgi:Tol biopolymer transport system component